METPINMGLVPKLLNEGNQRVNVLHYSLLLERVFSDVIGHLLDIDPSKSKSLGNSGQALSFNAKVNLLLDMKSISGIEGKKMQKFMEVRNQMMHNSDAGDFLTVAKLVQGLEKNLKEWYSGISKEGREDTMSSQFEKLFSELFNLSFSLSTKTTTARLAEIKADVFQEEMKIYTEAVDKALGLIENSYTEKVNPQEFTAIFKRNIHFFLNESRREINSLEFMPEEEGH